MSRIKVLLTGAAGRVGQTLLAPFREKFEVRTFDRHPVPGDTEAIIGDLRDAGAIRSAVEGVDVVVHLAATPTERPFVEELIPNNITGLYHLFDSAVQAGVRRIVFASTCQVVTLYPANHLIAASDPPRPQSLYGATKAFGEIMGRWHHDHKGLEFVAVRIGWFLPYDDPLLRTNAGARRLWLSPGDAVSIFMAAVEMPGIGFAVVSGTSRTDPEWLSLAEAAEVLGYEPRDDVASLYGALQPGNDRGGLPQATSP